MAAPSAPPPPPPPDTPQGLKKVWRSQWESALEAWSRYTKLSEPRWCLSEEDEKREGIGESFAMIRLADHAVVISLPKVMDLGLHDFAVPILAHEIGHHVYTPADLRDNARLLVRIRAGLPTCEHLAGTVANLYADLLINDRLQRSAGLDMAGVYKKLPSGDQGGLLWTLYLRIYEMLWDLPPASLAALPKKQGKADAIRGDASLGARLIRAYSGDWLDGAGRFAALCLEYLIQDKNNGKYAPPPWMDATRAGSGDSIPDGLAEIEDGEGDTIHPSQDEALTGFGGLDDLGDGDDAASDQAGGRAVRGGQKTVKYRSPAEYTELMRALGVELPDADLLIRYYREQALPHLIQFPSREIPQAADPLPEGVEDWDPGDDVSALDWMETLVRSPYVIPGETTVKRTFGAAPGSDPEVRPVDLYLGVDCSGSMRNPAYSLSYPVLAGTIVTLSALRAGARVMVALSGEPGEYSQTNGFIRDEREVLTTLTGYLGTGYAFGASRLDETFVKNPEHGERPVHLLIVTDNDIFHMLDEYPDGWDVARTALENAGGGGTMVLNIPASRSLELRERLASQGWNVHTVSGWEELVAFARAFSKATYAQGARDARPKEKP